MGFIKRMKTIRQITGLILLLFLISVFVINIIRPAMQAEMEVTYIEQVSETEYESDMVCDERILCIDDNEEALLWRLRMIGNARETIVLATFDLRADESGVNVMSALYDAAERGVRVKLLVDGIYQLLYLRDSDVFQALCEHENVDARFYNPVSLASIYQVNYRMHDKYIMVDDCMYMLGGRNTSDIFLGYSHDGVNIDRDILVYHTASGEGESFRQLREYFDQVWEESCVKKVEGKIKAEMAESQYAALRERYTALTKELEDFCLYDNWMEDTYEADKITLLSNGTHAGNKEPRILCAIEQLALTGSEVIIQTPYVICNSDMYQSLQRIASQSDVKIILNAVARGSNPWGCTDYLNNKGKILATGVDIYELMNEYAVHTKTVLIDDHISIVGSYNLDMRSTYLDTELMLVIDSEYLNGHIRKITEEYKRKSLEVLADATETEGDLYKERELSLNKKIFYGILRVIIRPFRHML